MLGSRQTVSSLLTPRESHPAAPHSTASREYHCLPCGLSRKESGTARYFESVVVARCRSAGRGVPLHTLFYLRSARGKYLTSDIRMSRYKLLLTATLFQQHVRGFLTPSLYSRWECCFLYADFEDLQFVYNFITEPSDSAVYNTLVNAKVQTNVTCRISLRFHQKNLQCKFICFGYNLMKCKM